MFRKLGIGCAVIVGLFVLLVIVVGVTTGGSKTSTTPTTPPLGVTAAPGQSGAPAAKQWVVIKQFAGDGIKDTEDFTVGNDWRIDWDLAPGQFVSMSIYLYRVDTKEQAVVASTQKAGSDTSFQRGAGTYYLKVNAVGAWKVAVQDSR